MSVYGSRFIRSNNEPFFNQNNDVVFNTVTILPHQLKVYEYLKQSKHKGLLLYHKMGSGKTISSIYTAIKLKRQTIIIGPKSSRKSFYDDLLKLSSIFKFNPEMFKFYTFQKIQNMLQSQFDIFNDKIIIIDEAHHLRNQTTQMMFIINSLSFAYKIILLSGTPIINHPVDMCVLVNIVKQKEVLPTDKSLFDFYYMNDTINLNAFTNTNTNYFKEIDVLKEKLSNAISYYEPSNNADKLKINKLYPKVNLSYEQLVEYKNYIVKFVNPESKHIVHLETDINTELFNIDFITMDVKKKNAFLSATRQLSNTLNNSTDSPKFAELIEIVKNGPKPAVIYSNYLANGIYPISLILNNKQITFKIIKGTTTSDNMNKIINEYNNRLFDVLLISSAASESINLLKTRQFHVLEPHFNEAKINQVVGRAIRYKSHDDLPPNERTIDIYYWCSVFPTKIKYKTADEYLIWLSQKKEKFNEDFLNIVRTVSI